MLEFTHFAEHHMQDAIAKGEFDKDDVRSLAKVLEDLSTLVKLEDSEKARKQMSATPFRLMVLLGVLFCIVYVLYITTVTKPQRRQLHHHHHHHEQL
eukprot:g538.t1